MSSAEFESPLTRGEEAALDIEFAPALNILDAEDRQTIKEIRECLGVLEFEDNFLDKDTADRITQKLRDLGVPIEGSGEVD